MWYEDKNKNYCNHYSILLDVIEVVGVADCLPEAVSILNMAGVVADSGVEDIM